MPPFNQAYDYIIQPGWKDSGPDHWQTHWQQALGALRVQNDNWTEPALEAWLDGLDEALDAARRPAIVIAHSLGCITVAHHARRFHNRIAGALLVAPADVERPFVPQPLMGFAPVPRQPLPFPARVVASTGDPYCKPHRAARMAGYWGASLVWLPQAGHINVDSGHRTWEAGWQELSALLQAVAHAAAA